MAGYQCGCDECVAGNPCIPVFTPTTVLYSGRACRYCGGHTVEGAACGRFLGWNTTTLPYTPRYAGVARARFWCDPCGKVTS